MAPLLSVIVPVYNVERYLEKCLRSIEQQSFTSFEVIVVNDGSTDSSMEIAEKFQCNDQRFKLINQNNLGLGGARNTGIKNAEGKYLFLLDSDDYISPNTFRDLVQYSEKKDLDVLVFNYDRVDDEGRTISSTNFGDGVYSKEEAFRKILSLKTSPQAWNKLYKTSLFLDTGIRYPERFLHEDLPVTYRLFWSADRIGYLNKSYYSWLVRSGSITQNFSYKHINDVVTSLLGMKHNLTDWSVFSIYENEYIECCVKMYNVMLKRSIEYEKFGCMDYLLYIIDSQDIVSDKQIAQIERSKGNFVHEFEKNYASVQNRVFMAIRAQTNKRIGILNRKSNGKTNSVANIVRLRLSQFGYYLFPLDSRRRFAVKKLIGR